MSRASSASPAATQDLSNLLKAVASGDRQAFRSLYDQTAPILYGICVRLMRDREAAQDVLQEAMVRIWTKAHLFDPSKGNALAWMSVVTRNCALSRVAAAPPLSSSIDEAEALAAPALGLADETSLTDLGRCLEKLNEKFRKCITLVYLQGLSYEELASHMGAPLGSVKSWVHRAVKSLAACMGE